MGLGRLPAAGAGQAGRGPEILARPPGPQIGVSPVRAECRYSVGAAAAGKLSSGLAATPSLGNVSVTVRAAWEHVGSEEADQ